MPSLQKKVNLVKKRIFRRRFRQWGRRACTRVPHRTAMRNIAGKRLVFFRFRNTRQT